ncbi:unnamed protein product, partial [marine sediment metagenome]
QNLTLDKNKGIQTVNLLKNHSKNDIRKRAIIIQLLKKVK